MADEKDRIPINPFRFSVPQPAKPEEASVEKPVGGAFSFSTPKPEEPKKEEKAAGPVIILGGVGEEKPAEAPVEKPVEKPAGGAFSFSTPKPEESKKEEKAAEPVIILEIGRASCRERVS